MLRHLQPFVGRGERSAVLQSVERSRLCKMTEAPGLAEFGLGCAYGRAAHLGFRVQGRSLLYRAPNFFNASIASSRWVSTNQPSASVYLRF